MRTQRSTGFVFGYAEKSNAMSLTNIVLTMLLAFGAFASQAQCPTYHNFYLQEIPAGVRVIYGPSFPNYVDGEFRWYINGANVKTQSVGSDYGWDSQYGWYSEYGPLSYGESVTVTFFDRMESCESSPETYTVPIPCSPPSIWQEYARVCGDNVARIQMRASSPGVSFELRKVFEGGGYQSYGWSTDGYLQDPDFTPYEADEYYVIASAGCGTIAPIHVNFYIQQDNNPPTISGTTSICEGVGTTLTASGATGIYKWYNGEGNFVSEMSTLMVPDMLPAGTYNYSAEMISAQPNGCVSPRRQTTVTVKPKPVNGTITSSSTSIRLGETIQITSASGVGEPSYQASSTGGATWNIFNNAYVGQYSFSFKPSFVGTYRIQLRNKTSCGVSADPNSYVDIIVDQDYNYIKEYTSIVEGVTETAVVGLPVEQKSLTTTFFDGLGRPLQVVNWQATPAGYDHLQPISYDAMGRESFKYLPYKSSESDGWYKPGALSDPATTITDDEAKYRTGEQYQFYQTGGVIANDQYPYAKTIFEPSPLNRVIKQGAPGSAWQPDVDSNVDSDKVIKHSYQTNSDSEVLRFVYDSNTGLVIAKANNVTSYYSANQLYANKTKDEHNNEVIEYVDKEGRTVCKKVQYGTDANSTKLYASTYYVYDDFGNLVVVLPPEAINSALGALTN